jgi:hypothetical protein
LIHSWLLNSVSESIAQSIVFIENVVDAWNDLKDRFAQGDLVRVSELMQEIYALKQDSKSVTEFYSELKILWEELEIYMPIPTCVCRSRCSCDSMIKARSNHTLLYAIRFLTGLNENFGMVKSQILLIDPLPSMTKISSMVLQFERQHGFGSNEESKVLVNAADSKKQNYYASKAILNLQREISIAHTVTRLTTPSMNVSRSMVFPHICKNTIGLLQILPMLGLIL